MNINKAYDTNALFSEKIMYLIKSLKNSIAHNDVVFDVRFKDTKVASSLCKFLENEICCKNIDFYNNKRITYKKTRTFIIRVFN